MDDLMPVLDPKKCLKTYTKCDKTAENSNNVSSASILQIPALPAAQENKDLTTKEAIKLLLEGTLQSKVCRYCLKIVTQLSHLDQIIKVAGKGAMYKVTIKDIVASFHPFKVADDPNFPNKICETCLDRAIAAYLFTQQCEQSERALKNCFEDMYEKLDKLDPLQQTKRRGRHKLHPNHNILHAEHAKVIDYAEPIIHIINTASEVVSVQDPISEFECLKCCEVLPDVESLVNHATIHPRTMWYNCRLCGTSFPKKHHLKKHFTTNHGVNKTEKLLEKPKYECDRCNITFDKYYSYLLHIDKHKFKTIMEHVIEKRMDKLCSLCFGKGQKMVELNEKVCLHGGNPELTGERSLYSVLASTLTKKKIKYQELHIPTQASSTKCVKRKKYGACEYTFSDSIVVAKETHDCHGLYLFRFTEPLSLSSYNVAESTRGNINNDGNEEINEVTSNVDVEIMDESGNAIVDLDVNAPLPGKMGSQDIDQSDPRALKNNVETQHVDVKACEDQAVQIFKDQLNFSFSDPNLVDIKNTKESQVITIKENKNETEIISCDENWIFDKCCKQDANKSIGTISNTKTLNNLESKGEPCKVCWLFKHSDKCGICGMSKDKEERELKEKFNIDRNTQNETVNSKDNVMNTQQAVTQDTPKNLWECNICLTKNKIGKEICDCCEAKRWTHTNSDNFALGIKKTDTLKDVQTINIQKIYETKLPELTPKLLPHSEVIINEENNNISNNNLIVKKEKKPLPSINSAVNLNKNVITPEEVSLMDTDMIETENLNNFTQCNTEQYNCLNLDEEAMDVQIPEETVKESTPENANTVHMGVIDIPNMETSTISNISANIQAANTGIDATFAMTNPLQFNLGWTDKNRKPKRKINKPHNK